MDDKGNTALMENKTKMNIPKQLQTDYVSTYDK